MKRHVFVLIVIVAAGMFGAVSVGGNAAELSPAESPARSDQEMDAAPVNAKSATASDYIHQGEQSYQDGRFEEAMAYYEKALLLDPESYEINMTLGTTHFIAGRLEQALPYLEKAAALKPDSLAAQLSIGVASKRLGQFDKAVTHLLKAQEIDPQQAGVYNELGETYYFGLKDAPQGIAFFEKALKMDPEDEESLVGLGKIYFDQQELEKSRQYFLAARTVFEKQGDRKGVELINNALENYF